MLNYRLIVLIYGSIFFLLGCKTTSDAESAAKEYCECLHENDVASKHFVALQVCEAAIISKYPLYRVFAIDSKYESLYPISDSLKKRSMEFVEEYTEYINKNCCKDVNSCNLLKDTFYIEHSRTK